MNNNDRTTNEIRRAMKPVVDRLFKASSRDSVTLPKPWTFDHEPTDQEAAYADGWNACLEEVRKAVPAATPAPDFHCNVSREVCTDTSCVDHYRVPAAERPAPTWQPIDDLPDDINNSRRPVLTLSKNGAGYWCDPAVLYFHGGAWRTRPEHDPLLVVYHKPLLWMPLPSAPRPPLGREGE